MLKLSSQCFKFAIKFNLSTINVQPSFGSCLLKNPKCISVINVTSKFSTQAETESKPSEVVRIYDGPLLRKIRFTKMLSLTSSVLGLTIQPMIYEKFGENPDQVVTFSLLYVMISIFTFGVPLALHHMTKKYIVWMDYNPEKDDYTAYTYTFFLRLNAITFKATDVSFISAPLANHLIKNKPFLIDPSNFNDLSHYKRMRGFDKEMDFSMNDGAPLNALQMSKPKQTLKPPVFPSFNELNPENVKPPAENEDQAPTHQFEEERIEKSIDGSSKLRILETRILLFFLLSSKFNSQ